ncbi:MAG TPA: hypothetical protein VHB20_05310 [Verrucomicrobiae bacterium]|jgi:hypothetical protein|nr:hypothetical protein [Verrucomicrobiae bacterium]
MRRELTGATVQASRKILIDWIGRRQGSAAELVQRLEEEAGWPARHALLGALDELRACKDLPPASRKYLAHTLNAASVREALAEGLNPNAEHQSSLDELFTRSRRFRQSRKFAEAVEFIARFRDYSPYNNLLVYLQNPMATYFATARHWRKAFGRAVKDEARGMIILAPRTPVLLVYDIEDTSGPPLPHKFEVFSQAKGRFDPAILDRTLQNAAREKIVVERKSMGKLQGGFATARGRDAHCKIRIALRADLDDKAAYAALCHELAHVFLGHVGPDQDDCWPCRMNLSQAVTEIEAEAVAHIVCRRLGLRTHSAEYLASFVEDADEVEAISFDLISRTAGRIEEMGRRLVPLRGKTGDQTPD